MAAQALQSPPVANAQNFQTPAVQTIQTTTQSTPVANAQNSGGNVVVVGAMTDGAVRLQETSGPVQAIQMMHLSDILIDSGSQIHVCPPSFFTEFPLQTDVVPVQAVAASGKPLAHFGDRTVVIRTENGHRLVVNFHAMDVSKPILAAGRLAYHGHVLQISGSGGKVLWNGNESSSDLLHPSGAVFYLRACQGSVESDGLMAGHIDQSSSEMCSSDVT